MIRQSLKGAAVAALSVAGAALSVAGAALPASAIAVPPGGSSVPLGSRNGCLVVVTQVFPARCSFLGAGGDAAVAGVGGGAWKVTHERKVAVCDPDTQKVTGFQTETVTDASGNLPVAATQTLAPGIVYTASLGGAAGWLAVGGPGAPTADMTTEPAVGPGPDYAGAEDGTAGRQVGDACAQRGS